MKLPQTPMRHENRVNFVLLGYLFVISFAHLACSQELSASRHVSKPFVINTYPGFKKSIKGDNDKQLVPLTSFITPLFTDWKYATTDNFTHQILYDNPAAFVRLPAAIALKKVQEELALKGLALIFFDAYRPYSVTEKMWKIVPDERYAANPAKGSGHNRGAAVDVSLVNISTKEMLPMPTGFDDFSEKASHNFMNLPENVLQNRLLLKTAMEKYGFIALSTEWWHYSLPDANRFELLDLSFGELEKSENQ